MPHSPTRLPRFDGRNVVCKAPYVEAVAPVGGLPPIRGVRAVPGRITRSDRFGGHPAITWARPLTVLGQPAMCGPSAGLSLDRTATAPVRTDSAG
jgi:hypothetical protein